MTSNTPTPHAGPLSRAGMPRIVAALASGDPQRIRRAVTGLGPVLRAVYDQGDPAWQAGAPADFLAATLYASPRYYLRLHAHAPGATDSDLHTHKGTVYSLVLSGTLTNTTAAPAFTHDRPGGLDVWRCACLADGTHAQHRTGIRAVIDPATITDYRLRGGQTFTVWPGDYHRLSISRDPTRPTVTLCLFEWADPDAPDAYVLTGRPTPVLARREMTVTAARTALARLLDTGPA
jgi:hypothetical protein